MSKNTVKGYKIDFTTNTLIMNYKFAAAANRYGTPEYNIYKGIMEDFPKLQTVVKSGRETTTPRYNKRFTYENMKKYIKTFGNADELMKQFNHVVKKSVPLKSPYKYVCDWFEAQFPDYKEIPTGTEDEIVKIIKAPNTKDYDKKLKKVS